MLRLRFLRVLLPLLLVVLGVLLWNNWKPRSSVHRSTVDTAATGPPRAVGLSVKEFSEGSNASFEARADVFEPHDDGTIHLEGIHDLEIPREDRGPLLVSAALADRRGAQGEYRWFFEEEVVFREPDSGLLLRLPTLEIDRVAEEARSSGDIRFEAPNATGRASGLVYSLLGQPGELTDPLLEDRSGGRITAEHARLLDGIRDVELVGRVRVSRAQKRLASGRLRLLRGPEDRLRQAVATEAVSGSLDTTGGTANIATERLEARWDAAGEIDFVALQGDALITRGGDTLSASKIEAVRSGGSRSPWKIDATDGVYVQGNFGDTPGLLRADRVEATLDASLLLRQAEATGIVSFEGRDLRAASERATFVATPGAPGTVELFGDDLRKARLARGQTRVAARSILTDVRGDSLSAHGLVEATLLPAQSGTSAPTRTRLFDAAQAIHFVSDHFESEDAGGSLRFEGGVRGWQGERNLSAGTVVLDQRAQTIDAQEAVSTRFPREAGSGAATEADYLQIGADRLEYDDGRGLAVYRGHVRVRLAEGWLEAQRVEVDLAADSRRIREIRASESVRIEFHRSSDGEMARPISGTADRLVYHPAESTVVLFGDQAPATVRRIGEGGGTTTGRVLRYRVDAGTLDVESGEQGSGRIRS